MDNKITDGITNENIPQFTNEKIEQIREKLKKNNSANLNENGQILDSGLPNITLKDCINIVDDFIEGKIDADELESFGRKMVIRSYIPLLEKMSLLMEILTKYKVSTVESVEIRITEFYKNIFFIVVLKGYGLIQINEFDSEDIKLMTYENYDKLFPLFYQYIMSFCKTDYKVFIDMLKDCTSFSGITNVVDALEQFDEEKISESILSNQELVGSLKENKDLINDIKDILFFNDSTTKEVVEKLKRIALEEVKNKKDNVSSELSEETKKKVRDLIEETKVELENKSLENKKIQEEKQKQSLISDNVITPTIVNEQTKKKRGRPKKSEVIKVDFNNDTVNNNDNNDNNNVD